MPQSQTTDKPMAPLGRATKLSRSTWLYLVIFWFKNILWQFDVGLVESYKDQ